MVKRILVLGSANVDFIFKIPRFHNPGETILGDDLVTAFGGKGANQAMAVRRLGAPVDFITKLGDDANGKSYGEYLVQNGFDKRFLMIDKSAPTGIAVIEITPEGENRIIVSPGANSNLLPEDLLRIPLDWQEVGAFVVQLESPLATVEKSIEMAKRKGVITILNPSPPRPIPAKTLALVDYLVPNETEAQILTGDRINGDEDIPNIASRLLRLGPKNVVITLGARGAFYKSHKKEIKARGFEVKPVDSTAAGDAFMGALAIGVVEARPIPDILRFANAAGALATTKLGAQPSLPIRSSIEGLLNRKISR